MIRAVVFDLGGVVFSSPFEAFARYERDNGLPDGFLRRLNATNPDDNAWARLERNQVDLAGFAALFEDEARAAGHVVDARAVLTLLGGEPRPAMIEAIRRCRAHGLKTAALTNNFVGPTSSNGQHDLVDLFDVVVESSKVGLRKPDPAIYRLVCDRLGVAPVEAVFLDDLGVNLKPARALGMTTIKVVDPDESLAALESLLGLPL